MATGRKSFEDRRRPLLTPNLDTLDSAQRRRPPRRPLFRWERAIFLRGVWGFFVKGFLDGFGCLLRDLGFFGWLKALGFLVEGFRLWMFVEVADFGSFFGVVLRFWSGFCWSSVRSLRFVEEKQFFLGLLWLPLFCQSRIVTDLLCFIWVLLWCIFAFHSSDTVGEFSDRFWKYPFDLSGMYCRLLSGAQRQIKTAFECLAFSKYPKMFFSEQTFWRLCFKMPGGWGLDKLAKNH